MADKVKILDGYSSKKEADAVREAAYDQECENLGCPTSKAERGTSHKYATIEHPDRKEWAIKIRPDQDKTLLESTDQAKLKDMPADWISTEEVLDIG